MATKRSLSAKNVVKVMRISKCILVIKVKIKVVNSCISCSII